MLQSESEGEGEGEGECKGEGEADDYQLVKWCTTLHSLLHSFFGCGNSFLYGLNTLQQRAPLQETHARGVLTRDVRTGYVKYSSD